MELAKTAGVMFFRYHALAVFDERSFYFEHKTSTNSAPTPREHQVQNETSTVHRSRS